MSIIDHLSLSKSEPSAVYKTALSASKDLFSALLGSEILASINSRSDFAQHPTKNNYSQAYFRHQRDSLEVDDRAKDEIHSAIEPTSYKGDDPYNRDQISESEYIENEPAVTNATERRGNNEPSLETAKDNKEHVAGNYNKDNNSHSSQGEIELNEGVLPTGNNEVTNSETIARQNLLTGSIGSIVFNASSDTKQETSVKNSPSVLTPPTQLGGLAATESNNKAIKSAGALKAEPGAQSLQTAPATDLAASIPRNSSGKPHSIIGSANQTNVSIKNPVVDGISSFSRFMANNTSNINNNSKGNVDHNAVNSSSTGLEGAQNSLPSSSINGSSSNLLRPSNSETKFEKPELLANNKHAEIPSTHQTLISSLADGGSDSTSGQVVSQTPTKSQSQIVRAPKASVVSNIPLQAHTTASNMVSQYGLGNHLNKVSSSSANTSEAKTIEHKTNLIAILSQDIKINIKDAQTSGVRTANAVGANILQAHQVAEGEINLAPQTVPVQRTTSALTPQSILPIENPAPLDVASNSTNKTNSLNVQGSNGLFTGNGTTNNKHFSGGNNSPQPNLENNQGGNQRASNVSAPSPTSSPVFGSEGATMSRSDGPTGQFSLSQSGNTTNTNSTAPTAQKPIPQPATNQVFIQLSKAVQNGQNKITVQLRPEELGRVEVKLDIGGDGRVKAMVMADKPETLDLLQKDSRVLERALQDAGLKTDNNSLSYNLQGKEGNGQTHLSSNAGTNPNEQNQAEQETQDDEAISEVDVSATAIGTTPEGAVNVLA